MLFPQAPDLPSTTTNRSTFDMDDLIDISMAIHRNDDIRQTLHAKDRAIIALMARGDHDAVMDAYQKEKNTGNNYPQSLLDLYRTIGIQQTSPYDPEDNRPPPLNSWAQYKTKLRSTLSSSFKRKFSHHLSLNTVRQRFATAPHTQTSRLPNVNN